MIRILHVDDDPDIREIVSLALSLTGGFGLTQHASGHAALAEVTAAPPDVLLLDLMMPNLNGVETLDRLRDTPDMHNVPAIFMTAYANDPTLEIRRQAKDVDVILKPIDPMQLGPRIIEMLGEMRG